MTVDGAPVERLLDAPRGRWSSVFLPDRLELIKGAPALRRAHLDQFVAALWPARAATRRAYAQALAQRNALLGRDPCRPRLAAALLGRGTRSSRAHGARADGRPRGRAVEPLGRAVRRHVAADSASSGDGRARATGPRSHGDDAGRAASRSCASASAADLERGFTGHGPHRDELASAARRPRPARLRLAGPAAARPARAAAGRARRHRARARGAPPLLLLDDVMSELDATRRARARRAAARPRRARA